MTTIERLRTLPARGKLLVGGLVVAACAAVAIAVMLGRDAGTPLFAQPLRPEQVGEVAERLAAWNVAFVPLTDNVRVDARRRNELLLRLSMARVPRAHVATSEEALQKAGPLTPQSVLDAEQRAGLAGDLELALRGVAGIEDARVMLAGERPSLFADDSPSPRSASVRLTVRPGTTLSREALAGIRSFVAGAVSGLDARRVAVLDDRGVALGEGTGAGDQAADLQSALQSALDGAFGPGATIVRVRVAYDPRQREIHDARREPLGAHAIISTRSDERYANDKRRYTKSTTSEDRGSIVHDERALLAAGATERVSVAILVDASRRFDVGKIREIASAALGLQPQRGDSISVASVPFQRAPQRAVALHAAALGYVASLVPTLLLVGGALLGLRLIARPALDAVTAMTGRATVRELRSTAATMPPEQVRAALAQEPPHTVAAVLSGLPSPTVAAVLEAYDGETRAAIVRNMGKTVAPVVRDAHALIASRT